MEVCEWDDSQAFTVKLIAIMIISIFLQEGIVTAIKALLSGRLSFALLGLIDSTIIFMLIWGGIDYTISSIVTGSPLGTVSAAVGLLMAKDMDGEMFNAVEKLDAQKVLLGRVLTAIFVFLVLFSTEIFAEQYVDSLAHPGKQCSS